VTPASTSFSTCTTARVWVRTLSIAVSCSQSRVRPPSRLCVAVAVNPAQLIAPDRQGLDFRYGSSGYYGGGNYTSASSKYSNSYSFKCGPGALREMFICQGVFGRAQHHARHSAATRRYMSAPAGYDSVSGDDDGTLMRIVYNHNRVYPGYSIVYSE
jgi:hypothetical protein